MEKSNSHFQEPIDLDYFTLKLYNRGFESIPHDTLKELNPEAMKKIVMVNFFPDGWISWLDEEGKLQYEAGILTPDGAFSTSWKEFSLKEAQIQILYLRSKKLWTESGANNLSEEMAAATLARMNGIKEIRNNDITEGKYQISYESSGETRDLDRELHCFIARYCPDNQGYSSTLNGVIRRTFTVKLPFNIVETVDCFKDRLKDLKIELL